MEDYTIKETYKLPSLGKIYPVEVPEEVTIRSMSINEEQMRLSTNGTWRSLAEILDACIVTPMPISTYDMCSADFTFLWHRLRVVTYGHKYPLICTCPYCSFESKFDIDLLQLPVTYYSDDVKKYQEFTLPVSDRFVTINYQTPHMLDAIEARTRAMREKQGKVSNITLLVQAALNTVDGEQIDSVSKEVLIRQLPMRDINKIIVALDKLNDSFGVGVKLEASCQNCGETFPVMFQQGSEFFRPEEDF